MSRHPVFQALLISWSAFELAAVWVGEDYWTSVYPNGRLERDRIKDDFLHFKVLRDQPKDAFIALIIQRHNAHFESFGYAHVDPQTGRVCGQFRAQNGGSQSVCGGFRVLSINKYTGGSPFFFVSSRKANAYDSVGYRRVEVARIWLDYEKSGQIFGGVNLQTREAYGVHFNGSVVEVSYRNNPRAYEELVEVLHVERGEPTVRWPDTRARRHVHRRHEHQFDQNSVSKLDTDSYERHVRALKRDKSRLF